MAPLVEALRQVGVISPDDHSVDGLPVSWFFGSLLLILLVSLGLAATGRSWRRWQRPCVGALVVEPGVRHLRAALERRPRGSAGEVVPQR